MPKTTAKIPKEARKEITFLLYNYKDIDKIIEQDRNNFINCINVSASAWKKGIKSYNNTLENQVIKIINNKSIKRLIRWKEILKDFFIDYKANSSGLEQEYVKKRFFYQKSSDEIMKELNITKREQRDITEKVISLIYYYAIDRGLYKIGEEAS